MESTNELSPFISIYAMTLLICNYISTITWCRENMGKVGYPGTYLIKYLNLGNNVDIHILKNTKNLRNADSF